MLINFMYLYIEHPDPWPGLGCIPTTPPGSTSGNKKHHLAPTTTLTERH